MPRVNQRIFSVRLLRLLKAVAELIKAGDEIDDKFDKVNVVLAIVNELP